MRIETLEQAKKLEDGQKVRALYKGREFEGEVYVDQCDDIAILGPVGTYNKDSGLYVNDHRGYDYHTWIVGRGTDCIDNLDWVETIEEFKYEVGDVLCSSYYSYELQVLSRFRHNEKEYYATSGCEPVELYTLDELDREGYKLKKETLEIDGKEYDIQEIKKGLSLLTNY